MQPPEPRKDFWQRVLPFTKIGLVLGAVYLAVIFFWRWSDAEQQKEKQRIAERQRAQRDVEAAGGWRLKILSLTASPGAVRRGESVSICYGTSNAKAVRFEPEIPEARPSYSNCLRVKPERDTTYKIIATDDKGNTETAEVQVVVVK